MHYNVKNVFFLPPQQDFYSKSRHASPQNSSQIYAYDQTAEVSKKFPGVIPLDPHSVRGRPLPHPTPSPVFGRTRGASAPVLGPKLVPSPFQPWLRP